MKYTLAILTVFIASLLIGCGRNSAPTSYYFPFGFKGEFVIVYGQKQGCTKKYEKGRRQMFIPDNGVLVTQFEFSDGFRNDLFYIQNGQGEYELVKEFLPQNLVSKGWKVDTTKQTTQGSIHSVRLGTASEIYNKKNKRFIIESNAFINEEESNKMDSTGNILSDAVFRQVEVDSLVINCR